MQKTATEKIMDMDAKIFVKKTIVVFVFEINSSGICTAIALINQDTTILFWIIVLVSKIQYLRTVIFCLVFYLVDVITEDKYP